MINSWSFKQGIYFLRIQNQTQLLICHDMDIELTFIVTENKPTLIYSVYAFFIRTVRQD